MNCEAQRLQAYADGELEASTARELEVHLEGCARCREELLQLQEADGWMAASLSLLQIERPPDPMASLESFEARFDSAAKQSQVPNSPWWAGVFKWSGALAAMALLLWWVPWQEGIEPVSRTRDAARSSPRRALLRPVLRPTPRPGHRRGMTLKGFPLQMFHSHRLVHQGKILRTRATDTRHGQVLRPLDWIQFRYRTTRPLHVMVVGINGQKVVFPYLPLEGSASLALQPGEGRLPDKALELDESLGGELFVLVASQSPFRFAQIKAGLLAAWKRSGGELRDLSFAPKGLRVRAIFVDKKASGTPKKPGGTPNGGTPDGGTPDVK